MEDILKQILDLHVEYVNEMIAEGAWCGHAYATEYFSDLRNRMIDLAKALEREYEGKRNDVSQTVSHILFKLSTDYDALISKIYKKKDVFNEWDRNAICDALNDAFKGTMEEAFSEFSFIYEQLSGKEYGPAIEYALTGDVA